MGTHQVDGYMVISIECQYQQLIKSDATSCVQSAKLFITTLSMEITTALITMIKAPCH